MNIKNNNTNNRFTKAQVILITLITLSIIVLYYFQYLAAWPLPNNLYVSENNTEDYLSYLYKIRLFKEAINANSVATLNLTQAEIRSVLVRDIEFAKKYSFESFVINDDKIELIINNKVRGQTYELWFSLVVETKQGSLFFEAEDSKVGRLSLPKIISQYLVHRMTESLFPDLYFEEAIVEEGVIKIVAKKE